MRETEKILGLFQRDTFERVLNKFNKVVTKQMVNKGDKFSRDQCPKHEHETKLTKIKSYASLVGSLMCANICTRPDLAFIVGFLGRFQSNQGESH